MMEKIFRGIRLVALDLDQTTLRQDKTLSPATRDALEAVIACGIHVAVASGRSFASLPDCIREIPGIAFAVTGNGAAVCRMDDGERLYERFLTRESVQRILALVEEIYPLEAFVDGVPYATAAYVRDPVRFGTPAAAIPYIQSTRTPVEDMRGFMRENADRLDAIDVVALDADRGAPEVRERLAREVEDIYITSSAQQLIEIAHRDAGKAAGIAWLAEQLGVAAAETAAFGDAENDRDMIRWAGMGVAVANADPGTQEAADLVTASNEEDGVALVLREILAARGR